jgi:hypothetical protein
MLDLCAISFHSLSIVQDVDFNMSEEEIESGIEEPLDPALENIARYR